MIDLWTYLKDAKKPILLYGTGNGADKILNELIKRKITVSGVFASDGFVRNRVFRGFKVISFNEAKEQYGSFIALISFGTQLLDVIDNIKRIAETVETYAPDVPVIEDNEIFDLEYARKHEAELKKAYNLLGDDISKKVFCDVINYKLTGKIDYLFGCETSKDESYELLGLKEDEVYLDLGAYNGDTVDEFIKHVKAYRKIIAVEPDLKNFRKLKNNTENLGNIVLFNAAVAEKNGTTFFSMKGGRNSSVGDGVEIMSLSVDGEFFNEQISYIKMDVEGNEILALRGANETLKKYQPCLNIAAYHKNADIFEIPILINSINPNYRIFLRHHPYIPAWDTNYYCV